MTTSRVPPIIPKVVAGRHGESGPAGRSRPPHPVAALASVSPATVNTIYAFSMVDKSGRVTDRSIVRELGWEPGTRLDIRERQGIIVVGQAVARAYAGYTDGGGKGSTATYVRASLYEVAVALTGLTGEEHPLATET